MIRLWCLINQINIWTWKSTDKVTRRTHPLLDGGVFMLHLPLLHGRINHQLIQLRIKNTMKSRTSHFTDLHTSNVRSNSNINPSGRCQSRPSLLWLAGSVFGNEALIEFPAAVELLWWTSSQTITTRAASDCHGLYSRSQQLTVNKIDPFTNPLHHNFAVIEQKFIQWRNYVICQ